MEQLGFITKLWNWRPKYQNRQSFDAGTHKEILARPDYDAPPCPRLQGTDDQIRLQKPSKIPYLETAGYKTLIRLKSGAFAVRTVGKMAVAETSLVQKNHQIAAAVKQKIAQLLVEKQAMTDIAHRLSISTSTVIRKLKEFIFEMNWQRLPEIMSWDEYRFKKGKMSFIVRILLPMRSWPSWTAEPKRSFEIIFYAIPDRFVWGSQSGWPWTCSVLTNQLAKQLFPYAQISSDRFHIIQHPSRLMNRVRIQIMNQSDWKSLEEYWTFKRYWKLLQQDSRKLSHKDQAFGLI